MQANTQLCTAQRLHFFLESPVHLLIVQVNQHPHSLLEVRLFHLQWTPQRTHPGRNKPPGVLFSEAAKDPFISYEAPTSCTKHTQTENGHVD